MYIREEFLQDIMIENIPIEEKEVIHLTGRIMIISGSIQANSVLAETSLVSTIDSYFVESTGRTESNIFSDKFIVLKNIRGTPGTCQHDTYFSGAAKVFSLLFASAKHYVAGSHTGESEITNKTKYVSIQETFVGITLECKNLNECLWIYDMLDCLQIPI